MKRFVETTRWNDPWFRKLSPKMKAFWGYICDTCDPAGVWIVDFELASFFIGEEITESEAKSAFNTRVVDISEGKWLIPQFVPFQYGKLSKSCRPHDRVFESLSKHGIAYNSDTLSLGYSKVSRKGLDNLEEEEEEEYKEEDRRKNGEILEKNLTDCTSKARIALAYLGQKSGARFVESQECLGPIAERIKEVARDYSSLPDPFAASLQDCKEMIDRCVKIWKGDPVMEKCLTPGHLFGPKFHGYFGQRGMAIPTEEKNKNPLERPFVPGRDSL